MDEEEFMSWVGSSLAAMHGLAISIAIVGHTAHLRNSTFTNYRLIGANARDVVSILDSLTRDRYRHGGVLAVSGRTIGQTRQQSGCWLDRTFRPVLGDLIAVRAKKPDAILATIEQLRRESTAHMPIFAQAERKPTEITAEDMWQAYGWLKEMLPVWLSRLNPPYQWQYDEQEVSDAVIRDLSSPILPGQGDVSAS